MKNIGNVSADDLKSQQDEYYLLVAEVIGGMSADLTDQNNRLVKAEAKILELYEKLAIMNNQNIILTKEILLQKNSQ